MRWALKRQFLIALSLFVIIALLGVFGWFTFFYKAPSCFDGRQNADETGVDCGGSCTKLCQAPVVSALWTRAVQAGPGVYHAVALVRNPDSSAGTTALPYHFSLYDADSVLIAERYGTMRLLPGDVVPLFEPDIVTGSRTPARAFVEFGNAVWEKMPRPANPLAVSGQNLDVAALRLTAHVANTSALPVAHALLTALLYDADGNLVNASQTTVENLPALAGKDVVFTWQTPFAKPVVRFDITPQIQ
jgi:hypothetical protein